MPPEVVEAPSRMRHLVFGVLLGPFFIGLTIVFFSVGHVFASDDSYSESLWLGFLAVAGALSLVSTDLLARRFGSQLTFHWFYLLGFSCLCLSFVEILHELGREYPWDPYGIVGYQILSRLVATASPLAFGLFCLGTAVLQDLLGVRAGGAHVDGIGH